MSTELKAITTYVDPDEAQALVLLANEEDRTLSQYTRRILQAHIAAAVDATPDPQATRKDRTR